MNSCCHGNPFTTFSQLPSQLFFHCHPQSSPDFLRHSHQFAKPFPCLFIFDWESVTAMPPPWNPLPTSMKHFSPIPHSSFFHPRAILLFLIWHTNHILPHPHHVIIQGVLALIRMLPCACWLSWWPDYATDNKGLWWKEWQGKKWTIRRSPDNSAPFLICLVW